MRHLARRFTYHGTHLITTITTSREVLRHDVHRIPLTCITSIRHFTSHGYSPPTLHRPLLRDGDYALTSTEDFEKLIMYNPIKSRFLGPYEGRRVDSAAEWIASTVPTDYERHVVTAYVAFGSNLGMRMRWIERALQELKFRGVVIKRTSSLWETEPMYVTDQERFLNGVIEVEMTKRHDLSLLC